jgi:hypothetical protein
MSTLRKILLNSTSPVLVIEFQDDPFGDYGFVMNMLGAAENTRVRPTKRSIVVKSKHCRSDIVDGIHLEFFASTHDLKSLMS